MCVFGWGWTDFYLILILFDVHKLCIDVGCNKMFKKKKNTSIGESNKIETRKENENNNTEVL